MRQIVARKKKTEGLHGPTASPKKKALATPSPKKALKKKEKKSEKEVKKSEKLIFGLHHVWSARF